MFEFEGKDSCLFVIRLILSGLVCDFWCMGVEVFGTESGMGRALIASMGFGFVTAVTP